MEIGTAERLQAEDIVWRHVWLKSVLRPFSFWAPASN
jgi:hypothetical protein